MEERDERTKRERARKCFMTRVERAVIFEAQRKREKKRVHIIDKNFNVEERFHARCLRICVCVCLCVYVRMYVCVRIGVCV